MFLHAEELSWVSDLLCLSDSSREAIKDETFLAWGFLHGFINDPHNQVIGNKLTLEDNGNQHIVESTSAFSAGQYFAIQSWYQDSTFSIASLALIPRGVLAATAALSISPVAKWHRQYSSLIRGDWVPFPEPGGPTRGVEEVSNSPNEEHSRIEMNTWTSHSIIKWESKDV